MNLSRGNTGEDGWGCVYTLCPEIDSCKKDGVEPLPYDGSRVWVGDRYLFGREGLVFGKMKKSIGLLQKYSPVVRKILSCGVRL